MFGVCDIENNIENTHIVYYSKYAHHVLQHVWCVVRGYSACLIDLPWRGGGVGHVISKILLHR